MSNAISHFADLLGNWSYHYPLPSQWSVMFKLPSGVSQSLESNIQELEHPEWEINTAFDALTKPEVLTQDNVHCFFVDSVTHQGESAGASTTSFGGGSINGGLIPGIFSNGRSDFASRQLTIGFRETAHSFADFVIRPWIILASHLGRIADRNSEIKTDIRVFSYGKSDSDPTKPVMRKKYTYYGCIPAKVSQLDLKYSEDSSIITYATEWHFDRYSISTLPPAADNAGAPEYSGAAEYNRKLAAQGPEPAPKGMTAAEEAQWEKEMAAYRAQAAESRAANARRISRSNIPDI